MRARTENYNIIGWCVMHVAFAIWIMMWTKRKYWWCFHFYRRFSHVFGSCKVRACAANDTHGRSIGDVFFLLHVMYAVCTQHITNPHRLINVKSSCDYHVLEWTGKRFTWWWRLRLWACEWDKINRPMNARFDAFRHPTHMTTYRRWQKGWGRIGEKNNLSSSRTIHWRAILLHRFHSSHHSLEALNCAHLPVRNGKLFHANRQNARAWSSERNTKKSAIEVQRTHSRIQF